MFLRRVVNRLFFVLINCFILLVGFYNPAFSIRSIYSDSGNCCASTAVVTEKKNLTRTADPVILQGGKLKALLGKSISNIRVYAAPQGVLIPIPYQIDERDAFNNWVLPRGPKANLDKDHELLDENDELVFMAKDLGDRISKESWISGYEIGLEVEVQDPLTAYRGWAYIFYFSNPPERSPVDYVRYMLSSYEHTISTDYYLVSSPPEGAYYTKLLIKEAGGGNGKNLIKKSRIEGRARLEWFFLLGAIKTFKRDEDDIRFRLSAYKDGPVRVIIRGKPELELIFGIKLPSEEVDSIYYLNHFYYTNIIHSPIKLSRYCSQASVLGALDFNENALGMKFYNSNNRQGVVLDGVMSEAEKNLDRSHQEWSVLTGKQGSFMTVIQRGPTLSQLKGELFYIDTTNLLPDGSKQLFIRIGHLFDLLSVNNGSHQYRVYFYFLPSYHPGDELTYLNIMYHPLNFSIRDEMSLEMGLLRP
jgi:hypothetical protein